MVVLIPWNKFQTTYYVGMILTTTNLTPIQRFGLRTGGLISVRIVLTKFPWRVVSEKWLRGNVLIPSWNGITETWSPCLTSVTYMKSSLWVFFCNNYVPRTCKSSSIKIESLDELSTFGVTGHNSEEIISTLRVEQRSLKIRKRPLSFHPIGSRSLLVWEIEKAKIQKDYLALSFKWATNSPHQIWFLSVFS